jgi:hypothetical protein
MKSCSLSRKTNLNEHDLEEVPTFFSIFGPSSARKILCGSASNKTVNFS